jgi:transcriptional regulator with XRE-family HTH domain
MDTIASRVRFARNLGGISARRLGLLAGRSPQWAAALERGQYAAPSAESLRRVAAVLGCDLNWLLTGSGGAPTVEVVQAAIAATSEAA